MKKVKVNKISVTGKSYKLVAKPKGFLQLIETTSDDSDALSIIKKGSTPFYCPICGKPECIQQPALVELRNVLNLHIDINRSFYREIRTCLNNQNGIKNKENIRMVMENPDNKEAALKLLENQNKYFYLIENFSLVWMKPPYPKEITCPSCGSHKFHSKVSCYMQYLSIEFKYVRCPACSMRFGVSNIVTVIPAIIDQLHRKMRDEAVTLIPMGKEIKHIFISFDFTCPVKVDENRRLLFSYPTEYFKLDSSIGFKEFLSLFQRLSGGEKIITKDPSDNEEKEAEYIIMKFHMFFPSTVGNLVVEVTKGEVCNALMVFIRSRAFSEINFMYSDTEKQSILKIKRRQLWINFYFETLLKYLENKDKIRSTLPTANFVFESEKYPSQVDNLNNWKKLGKWTKILTNEITIWPSNP